MNEIELLDKLQALKQILGEGHPPSLVAAVLICERLDKIISALRVLGTEKD